MRDTDYANVSYQEPVPIEGTTPASSEQNFWGNVKESLFPDGVWQGVGDILTKIIPSTSETQASPPPPPPAPKQGINPVWIIGGIGGFLGLILLVFALKK